MLGKTNAGAGGTKVFVEEEKFKGKRVDLSPIEIHEQKVLDDSEYESMGSLPYEFYYSNAFVFNNEIHMLGGYSPNNTKHYKWNGLTWSEASTIPFEFYTGPYCATAFNNEIHIIQRTKHYKWDGSSWSLASTTPRDFSEPFLIVFRNELHALSGTRHHKWNGSSWTELATLPYSFSTHYSAVVYNNELHIICGENNNKSIHHYKWNGSSWTELATTPIPFWNGSAVVYNNEIHIFGNGSYYSRTSGEYPIGYGYLHYKWTGSEWIKVSTIPYLFAAGNAVVFKDDLYLVGGMKNFYYDPSNYGYNFFKLKKNNSYTLPIFFYYGRAVIYKNELHVLGGYDINTSSKSNNHYKWNGSEWVKVSTLPENMEKPDAIEFNGELHIFYLKNHYKWDGSSWVLASTLPVSFTNNYGKRVFVFKNELYIAESNIFKWNGSEWIKAFTTTNYIPVSLTYGRIVIWNNEFHVLGGYNSNAHYKLDGDTWVLASTIPYAPKYGLVVSVAGEIHIMGDAYNTNNSKKHYKWDGTEWIQSPDLPFEVDSHGDITVLNGSIYIFGDMGGIDYPKGSSSLMAQITDSKFYSAEFTK